MKAWKRKWEGLGFEVSDVVWGLGFRAWGSRRKLLSCFGLYIGHFTDIKSSTPEQPPVRLWLGRA